MSDKNSYGLERAIPQAVKQIVRQQCGFGCVICGSGIIDYEHHTPEFKDAKIHDPAGITLLCPQCHAKKTRGYLSRETLLGAIKNPICLTTGFSKEVFDIGKGHPQIHFAGSKITECPVPIEISGQPLIIIAPPDINGSPFLISAKFTDSKGDISLEIVENEWHAMNNSWDVEVSAGRIQIFELNKKPSLLIVSSPPNEIIIEKIASTVGAINIEGDKNRFIITDIKTGNIREFKNCISSKSPVGFSFG